MVLHSHRNSEGFSASTVKLRLKMAFDVNSHEMALRHAVANTFGMPELGDWKNVNQEEDRKTRQRAVNKLKQFF